MWGAGVFLVWGMFLAAMIWAVLPLPNRRARIAMQGLLLSAIAAVCVYAVDESGPAAIVPLCFVFGPAVLIAASRLFVALRGHSSPRPNQSPADALFGSWSQRPNR
ncbi:hypothetical protein [Microbispora amethystogenes]|uniref:Uncharacterized protein n=1 Tax=Microbispora amethystogenes TaxID=1427754 RepID=A0ABQ4FBE4_9ACTN|nr:hypothetical protein [Microbispora amethystogenes]GIH32073.1 hypothetical protein Mam01_22370 [Microbispora amethystogenes]